MPNSETRVRAAGQDYRAALTSPTFSGRQKGAGAGTASGTSYPNQ